MNSTLTDRRRVVDAFEWNGIGDLAALIAWVEGHGADYEKWFTLGADESDPAGPLYMYIPGATLYGLDPGEMIVKVSPGLYAPYPRADFDRYYIKSKTI